MRESVSIPSILYEDDAVIVFDKPAGLVVHPAAGHRHGTLVDALRRYLPADSEMHEVDGERLGLVHRLDQGTTGVLLVARTLAAKAQLMRQFAERRVRKTYLALVMGRVASDRGIIEGPVGRSPRPRIRMAVTGRGRSAETGFQVRERLNGVTALEVFPKTGRTHQIRVHLAGIGHPVVGDRMYGGAPREVLHRLGMENLRPLLHAWRLEFKHPVAARRLVVTAPIPPDFSQAVECLGGQSSELAEPEIAWGQTPNTG